jgi:hypothetical protein
LDEYRTTSVFLLAQSTTLLADATDAPTPNVVAATTESAMSDFLTMVISFE